MFPIYATHARTFDKICVFSQGFVAYLPSSQGCHLATDEFSGSIAVPGGFSGTWPKPTRFVVRSNIKKIAAFEVCVQRSGALAARMKSATLRAKIDRELSAMTAALMERIRKEFDLP